MRQELGICKGLLMETKMHDPRMNRLAEILTCHSTKIEVGEFVLIEGFDIPTEMVIVLIRAVRKAGEPDSTRTPLPSR